MIQIIDNFDHRSKLPNFARDSFATLQEMRSCPDSDIDEGHISYCVATNKHYKFNSSNSADETLGKWREWKGEKGDKGDTGDTGKQGPQGVKGDPGEDGRTYYTWIRYADTASGGGISNFPDGKDYIGLAYNKDTAIESNDPDDYTWSKIKGEEGVAGPKGDDGETLYTWIKYADTLPTSSSSTIYDIPNDNTKYIGISVNNNTATESTDPMVYTWSLFKGKDGIDGSDGVNGKDGRDGRIVYPAGIYDATVTYTATDTKAPYVLHGENYWVMNKTTSWLGTANENKTPEDNYNQYGDNATWIPMEQYDAIYTKLLIADNGTLGSFVFNGDYMFSQQGIDYLYNTVNNYEDFGVTDTPFKWNDGSIWTIPYSDATATADTITISSTTTYSSFHFAQATELPEGQKLNDFYVEINGLDTESTTNYIAWNYVEANGDINTEYIRSSGIFKLHSTVQNTENGNTASIQLYRGSTLTSNITIKILPTTFTPNLQINGRSGDIIINKGTFKGSIKTDWYKIELSSSGTDVLAIAEADTLITITGSGTSPSTIRINPPSFIYSSSLAGKVLTTFYVINLSSSVLNFNNIMGRYFPSYTFPGGNEYSNVYVKQYGQLHVAIILGGAFTNYYFQVLNPWDFELSTAYNSTAMPTSKTFG